jgi:hypothetical protein
MLQLQGAEDFSREPYFLYGERIKTEGNEVDGVFLNKI